MSTGDTYGFYEYISDSGGLYAVKMSVENAGQGGFSTQVDPKSTAVWAYGAKNLRRVYGKDSAGHRTHLACHDPAVGVFATGGSFTLRGRTYTAQGSIGEKRKENHIG